MKKITVSLILSSVLWVGSVAAQTLADGQKFSRNEEFEKAEQVYSSLIAKKAQGGRQLLLGSIEFLGQRRFFECFEYVQPRIGHRPYIPIEFGG